MSVTVRHLNADSTFLLIFSPEAHPVRSVLKAEHGAFSVLIDPWLVGSSIVTAPWFAITRRVVPSAIQHLSEIEEPDVVVVSQNKPDHCHKETLLQLRPEGKTIIAAEPGAAKAIKSWNHFDPNRVYGLPKYDPKPKFQNCLRLRIPPLSPEGHAGEVSIAFIPAKNYMTGLHNAFGITYLPPTQFKSIAPVSTIDLPKRTKYFHIPLSPVTEPPHSPPQPMSPQFVRPMSLDVPRNEPPNPQGHRPQLSRSSNTASSEFLPLTEQWLVNRDSTTSAAEGMFATTSSTSHSEIVGADDAEMSVTSATERPSKCDRVQLHRSFDFEKHPLFTSNDKGSIIGVADEPADHLREQPSGQPAEEVDSQPADDLPLRRRKSSKFTEDIEPPEVPFNFGIESEVKAKPKRLTDHSDKYPTPLNFVTALPTPPDSPAMVSPPLQRPLLRNSNPLPHSPATTSAPSPSMPAANSSSAQSSPAVTATPFSQRRSLHPTHQQSISSIQAYPPSPITPGRPKALSIIYAPHGLPFADLQPYIQTHLVRLPGALPLTLLLHAFDHAQNPWYLGGNIMTGAQGGVEIAQTLMARCWISAHDEPKDDRGVSVKQLKVKRQGAEEVKRALWQGEDGAWLSKRGWACDVRSLDVGREITIGQSKDLLAGMEGKRESRPVGFEFG